MECGVGVGVDSLCFGVWGISEVVEKFQVEIFRGC
jgi:hypothetical protein